jgi:hypothetical protein
MIPGDQGFIEFTRALGIMGIKHEIESRVSLG